MKKITKNKIRKTFFQKIIAFTLLFLLITIVGFSQPYVDILNAGCQTFSSPYKNATATNLTNDFNISLFFPKQFKNKDVLLMRISAEQLDSRISGDSNYYSSLYAYSLPLGIQLVSKNQKWKTVLLGIPKIAGEVQNQVSGNNFQMGGVVLFTYEVNNNLKYKIGLYYNREAFGNFFVPLGSIEWTANKHWKFYGILPSNYYVEYKCSDKLFWGLNFKSYTRSFRLSASQNKDYVRYNEEELKFYAAYFLCKKIVAFAEAGYNLGNNPIQYNFDTAAYSNSNLIYSPLKNYFIFNFGLAYRLRFDGTLPKT